MLTVETADFLNAACRQSNELWDQGGLTYLYLFGYQRAHTFVDRECLKQGAAPRHLSLLESSRVALFFSRAFDETHVSEAAARFAETFLEKLQNDFADAHGCIYLDEDNGTNWELTLMFLDGDNFHSLELFWSMD